MSRGYWRSVGSPGARGGGSRKQTISDAVRARTQQRILACATEHFEGKYTRIDVRFRGAFCYVDAYQEPDPSEGYPGRARGETQEECLQRLRETPIHLFRLRYAGSEDRWELAMYTYSGQRYERCVFGDGSFIGTPEEAFMLIAGLYLQ